jgi:exopolysaccharide biosynthesis protein
MQQLWPLSALVAAGVAASLFSLSLSKPKSNPIAAQAPAIAEYKVFDQPDSVAHVLTIPSKSRYIVRPFVSESLATVAQVAAKTKAITVLNAGFFDPANQKTISHIVVNGRAVANPKDNERLVNNPKLAPYLNAILNRSELRVYECGKTVRYDIVLHRAPMLADCQLVQSMGGGPQLLPVDTSAREGFTDTQNGKPLRDAIGSIQPNARTAVGLKADGSLIWLMVAQKTPQSGMTLAEVAHFLKDLGAIKALNLDGGTSSSLYYQGKTFYGKRDDSGQAIARQVKSVLLLLPSGYSYD